MRERRGGDGLYMDIPRTERNGLDGESARIGERFRRRLGADRRRRDDGLNIRVGERRGQRLGARCSGLGQRRIVGCLTGRLLSDRSGGV